LEKVWLEPNLFQYKYPNTSQPSHSSRLPAYADERDRVPKRRYIKFRRRGITQKKADNIHNMNVRNRDNFSLLFKNSLHIWQQTRYLCVPKTKMVMLLQEVTEYWSYFFLLLTLQTILCFLYFTAL